jgi:fermentation-respiration switch protein FrsA (DUF1100 family)
MFRAEPAQHRHMQIAPILFYAWKATQIVLLIVALSWLAALALLWTFQRDLLYPAPRELPGLPPAGYRQVQIETSDGLALGAWYRPASAGRPTILFFSGNAASLPASAEWCQALAEAGFGLFLLSYRGYDGNPGAPSEQGLYRDGRAALAWLAGEGVKRPVLAGLSLGSGVAVEMAYEAALSSGWPDGAAPSALLLFSPYRSIPDVAAERYPIFPIQLLAKDRFDTASKLGTIRVPIFVAQGEDDRVVPFVQGRAVYDAAPEPKRFVAMKDVGHDYSSAELLPAIEAFLAGVS